MSLGDARSRPSTATDGDRLPAAPAVNLHPLCAIVDAEVASRHGWSVPDLARSYLRGGARFLQVRAKAASSAELLGWCQAVVAAASEVGAAVVVNDRADIARLVGASGVHVGQDDLTPSQVRRVVGAAAIVGLSTHSREQVLEGARVPWSYLAVGPVFGTGTKDTGVAPVGLDLVRFASRATPRPIVAIGGITIARVPAVLEAGARSVAVIADLLATGDPEARTRAYVEALGGG